MPCSLYQPEGLDLSVYLPDSLKRYAPEACYFLHQIECSRVFYKKSRTKFVSLKAEYLRNVMTRQQMKPIRDALLAAELIECDGKYVVGEKSLGYRLGRKLRSCYFKPRHCPKRIDKRLTKYTSLEEKMKLPAHLHLRKWVHLLKIDLDLVRQHAVNRESVTSAEMIEDQRFWCIPDSYGRFHSNVTSLSTHLRSFLSVNGLPLVFVDVVNSQPLFLSLIASNYFQNDNEFSSFYNSKSVSNSSPNPAREGVFLNPSHYDGHFVHSLQERLGVLDVPEDVKLFKEICESGMIYETLMVMWNMNRKKAKNVSYAEVLFCRKKVSWWSEQFRKQFPNVMHVVNELKSKDHCHAGQMLQRAESSVIIHRACETMRKEHPNVPIITIHDSIGTNPQYVELVRDAMLRSFSAVGLQPQLK